ncbi:MAG: alpha/beta hydrolase, partial [Candidatus Rokuibacteriota bacterium]
MKLRWIDTSRGLRVRVFEAGSGAPVVFFHGAGGFLADNPFLDLLARRYRVLAPEWPGFG